MKRGKPLTRKTPLRAKRKTTSGPKHWVMWKPSDFPLSTIRSTTERTPAAPIAKVPRLSLEPYLQHIRSQPCAFCGTREGVQAHHVEVKGMGGAQLNDATAIPACARCHMRCHGNKVDGLQPIPERDQWINVGVYLSTWLRDTVGQ